MNVQYGYLKITPSIRITYFLHISNMGLYHKRHTLQFSYLHYSNNNGFLFLFLKHTLLLLILWLFSPGKVNLLNTSREMVDKKEEERWQQGDIYGTGFL